MQGTKLADRVTQTLPPLARRQPACVPTAAVVRAALLGVRLTADLPDELYDEPLF
ncbi:MAG: hypothetical protein ACRDRU_28570 [Pseudonocardiaceae bacterium]